MKKSKTKSKSKLIFLIFCPNCKNIISDVLSSDIVQPQKRSGGLTNVNFKVLFGCLQSSLIGLHKQLSNVTVSHYKETFYIRDLKPALDVIISSEKADSVALYYFTVTNFEFLMPFPYPSSILYKWSRHNLLRSL